MSPEISFESSTFFEKKIFFNSTFENVPESLTLSNIAQIKAYNMYFHLKKKIRGPRLVFMVKIAFLSEKMQFLCKNFRFSIFEFQL